ncbi:MAG: hypothetical protein ABI378_13005 [Chitinophagaceae bacterium]
MKKTILLVATLVVGFAARAQADYNDILQKTFTQFDTTYVDQAAKVSAGNRLVLIAKKFSNDWAPQYYAAYSRAQLSYFEKDEAKRDAYLDEADAYLADAVHLLGKETDETHVVTAILANARMAVKPGERYQKYGKIFDEQLEAAKALNPDNPRIYLERGISKFYMPKMFGGGAKAATPYFEKAKELFSKEAKTAMTEPHWGQTANNYFLEQVKSGDKE